MREEGIPADVSNGIEEFVNMSDRAAGTTDMMKLTRMVMITFRYFILFICTW